MRALDEFKDRFLYIAEDLVPDGKLKGSEYWHRCPFHNEKTASFSINVEKGTFSCFGCGESGDIINLYAKMNNIPDSEAIKEIKDKYLSNRTSRPSKISKPKEDIQDMQYMQDKWDGAESDAEIVKSYLKGRGIVETPLSNNLRFSKDTMIAKVVDKDGNLKGIHKTILQKIDGKVKRVKKGFMQGSKPKGNSIHFGKPTDTLGVAEGIETALSVKEALPEMPMWAALSANFMGSLEMPDTVKKLYVFYDKDKNDVGKQAAIKLAKRYADKGVSVYLVEPPMDIPSDSKGVDFNDVLLKQGKDAIVEAYRKAGLYNQEDDKSVVKRDGFKGKQTGLYNKSNEGQNYIVAENAFLCSLMLQRDLDSLKLILKKVEDLGANDFYDKRNGELWNAIKHAVREKNAIPDIIILKEYYLDIKHLTEIIEHLPIPINIYAYAQKIKNASIERQIANKKRELGVLAKKSLDYSQFSLEIQKIADNIKQLSEEIEQNNNSLPIEKYNENNIKKPSFVCDVLPRGYVSLLAAPSGTGKTYTVLHFAFKYIEETGKKALVWLAEDITETDFRIQQMLTKTSWMTKAQAIKDKIYAYRQPPTPLLQKKYGSTEINQKAVSALKNALKEYDFLALDPLAAFYGENENDNTLARLFMNTLSGLINSSDKVILLTHHTNKANTNDNDILKSFKESIRGASAFVDAPRAALFLRKKGSDREVIIVKSNLSKTGIAKNIEMPFKDISYSERSSYGW